MLLIILIVAFILIAVRIEACSFTLYLVIDELAFVATPIWPGVDTVALLLVVFPVSIVDTTITILIDAY